MKKKNNLKQEIFKYFLLFSILFLSLLWILQFLLFPYFYKEQKTSDIILVAAKIKKLKTSSSFEEKINQLAFDKSVCIEIDDANFYEIYSSRFFGKGCISNIEVTHKYKFDFLNSNVEEKTYEIVNPNFNNTTIVHAIKLKNNTYAFINASIEAVDGTTALIQKELFVISILILLVSYVLANFIASQLSKPIKEMNEKSKNLAKGDFKFELKEENKIQEIEELSTTLNYVKEELQKTDELRRDLMANVSHDLKTPLTMIKGTAEMAKDLHKNDTEKQEKDMDTIISEVNRLEILVNDILELSKMESIDEKLQLEKIDLIECIDNILKRYDVLEETEDYHFDFIHKSKKLFVTADKKKLEQVIYNLINNAIHYTGEDNKVIIKITEKSSIRVEVIDTGKGIKEEDLPYIWDKYYKSNKNHKRNKIGTGLGLSIVKKILEEHHFPYGVERKEKGTAFYFEIKKED